MLSVSIGGLFTLVGQRYFYYPTNPIDYYNYFEGGLLGDSLKKSFVLSK